MGQASAATQVNPPDIYVDVQNGVVVNVSLASTANGDVIPATWVDVTNIIPQPSIGWTYDGKNFTPPPPGPPPQNLPDYIPANPQNWQSPPLGIADALDQISAVLAKNAPVP